MLKEPNPNSGAENKADPAAQATQILVRMLMEQVKELWAKHEAMRLVLQAHGLLPHDEYETHAAECRSIWETSLATEAHRFLKDAIDRDLQQLLESHKGKQQ